VYITVYWRWPKGPPKNLLKHKIDLLVCHYNESLWWVPSRKLRVAQSGNSHRFTTTFILAYHQSLPWVKWLQFTPFHSIFVGSMQHYLPIYASVFQACHCDAKVCDTSNAL
jgi:cytochrome c1